MMPVLLLGATAILTFVTGIAALALWSRRDQVGRDALVEARWMRRRDRARKAVVVANENLYGEDVERALKWAKRAVRLQPRNPEAHAVFGSCSQAVDQYGQAIIHHRRAEDVATDLGRLRAQGAWRSQNAVDAVQACMRLRSEATEDDAQVFWDEASAWARLAYEIDADNAAETFAISPWLASFTPHGGEAWLQQ